MAETETSPTEVSQLKYENIRLKVAVEELSILNEIATAISSTLDVQEVIDLIIISQSPPTPGWDDGANGDGFHFPERGWIFRFFSGVSAGREPIEGLWPKPLVYSSGAIG